MTTPLPPGRLFVCPACDSPSSNPDDAADGFCGHCHWQTGDRVQASLRPDLFEAHGRRPPDTEAARLLAAQLPHQHTRGEHDEHG